MSGIRPFDYINHNRLKPKPGCLLLSEPFLADPYFKRAVIFLAEHNENGSLGFIINKPVNMRVSDAVAGLPDCKGELYFGGPVNKDLLFYVHTLGGKLEGSVEISKGLFWGGNFEGVKNLFLTNKVKENEIRFFVGYSGWSAGQLDEEMKTKSWIVANPTIDLMATVKSESLWRDTLVSLGKEFSIIANFPEDPAMN